MTRFDSDRRGLPPLATPSRGGRRARARRAAGFSLVELLVGLLLVVLVMVAVLGIIDLYSKLSRAQMQVSDMQQAVRIAQYEMVRHARMTARGGVLRGTLPAGGGVAVTNNVAAGTRIGDGSSPLVETGTDILTLRGVVEGTLYQIGEGTVTITGSPPTGGTVTITDPGPWGVPQDTAPIVAAVNGDLPETLLLVSSVGDHAVVRVDPDGALTDVSDPARLVLEFTIDASGLAISQASACLDPTQVPPCLPAAIAFGGSVGLLEEYRYYVRADTKGGEPAPHLARGRYVPGTDIPYADPTDADQMAAVQQTDISDNVMDLQFALAVDVDDPAGSGFADGQIFEDGSENDDWLFNAAADTPVDGTRWNPAGWTPSLFYLRINTLVRTDRRDLRYVSPPIQAIEDTSYTEPRTPGNDTEAKERMFRRRWVQTVVDLRNLS